MLCEVQGGGGGVRTLRLGDHLGAAASPGVHLAGHGAGGGAQGLLGADTACMGERPAW